MAGLESWQAALLGAAITACVVLLAIWWRQQTRRWGLVLVACVAAALLLSGWSGFAFHVADYRAGCDGLCPGYRGAPIPTFRGETAGGVFRPGNLRATRYQTARKQRSIRTVSGRSMADAYRSKRLHLRYEREGEETLIERTMDVATLIYPQLKGTFVAHKIFRWQDKVPTFRPGYLDAMGRFWADPQEGPVFFCGDYFAGPSTGGTLFTGLECVQRLLKS